MKKIKNFLLMLLCTTLALGNICVNVIHAEGLNVVRGGDDETFIDNLSIEDADLFIDLEKININNLEYTSTIDGLKLVDGRILDNSSKTTKVFVVERRNMSNNADGFNIDGNLVITYKDAFLAKDGTRSDLILTIDNIYTKNVATESVGDKVVYYGIFNADGAYFTTMTYGENLEVIRYGATDEEVQSGFGIKGTSRTARRLNFSIGSLKNGKFVFGVRDLDVEEQITLRNADNNYTGEFVESIEINSGTDKIYVPETNFLDVVGSNIRATALDDGTWNSGFLSIFSTDNSFTWRAGGTNVNTSLFETLPFHKVEDSVIGGGEIKYVKSDVETDQGLIIAGGGDSVSIVTRPLEGHKIKKITVDGEDVTPEDKLSEYTYSFNDIHEDHEIIAEYEPFTYKINYDANGGEGDMPSQTFTYDDAVFMTSENAFTKDGHKFLGYKVDGRDELITSPEDLRDLLVSMGDGAEINLVAQWEYIPHTQFVDEEGNELSPIEEGSLEPKDIDNYVLINTEDLGNGDLKHVYHKLTTDYVDEEGNELLLQKDGALDPEDIENYVLVETQTSEKGDKKHIYHQLKTSFLDEEGKPLLDSEVGILEPKDIEGYKLIETKNTKSGDVEHIYHKLQTSWVDKDGKPLKETKDGSHPSEEFEGYKLVETIVKENGDVVHIYEPIKYPIVYVLNGGTNNKDNPEEYTINDEVDIKNPTKLFHKFMGWKEEPHISKGSTGEKTFTAIWDKEVYPIKYILNGGINNSSNPVQYTAEDEIKILNPSREGYKFLGWEEGNNISKGSSGEKVFTAKWEKLPEPDPAPVEKTFTVTFKDGETVLKVEKDIKEHGKATAPTVTKAGYKFEGWDIKFDDVTSDLIVTAKWSKIEPVKENKTKVVNTATK